MIRRGGHAAALEAFELTIAQGRFEVFPDEGLDRLPKLFGYAFSLF